MLTVIKTDLVERELTISKKTTPICLNAFKDILSKTVEVYKGSSLQCNFHELISASVLFLEVCVTHAPGLALSREMILSAASEMEKSCRRCLDRILFEKETHDPEAESEEIGIRLSVLQIMNMIRELGLYKEDLLLEKSQAEIENTLQSLKPQLITEFNQIIENCITSLRFIDKRDPALSLLVRHQGYIGYLIGVVSRITKKKAKDFYFLPRTP